MNISTVESTSIDLGFCCAVHVAACDTARKAWLGLTTSSVAFRLQTRRAQEPTRGFKEEEENLLFHPTNCMRYLSTTAHYQRSLHSLAALLTSMGCSHSFFVLPARVQWRMSLDALISGHMFHVCVLLDCLELMSCEFHLLPVP